MNPTPPASSSTPTVLFCSQCGTRVEWRIPAGETRNRAVCPECNHIHYDNPKCIVGTIPVHQNKILLCQRAIEPGYGLWTLPAGFMECNETIAQGAQREALEEACAHTHLIEPIFALIDIPHIGQIHAFFRAELLELPNQPLFAVGEETMAVQLFAIDEIPWDDIAFNSVRWALKTYIHDFHTGTFHTHHHCLKPR